jgi:predicted HD superfamily hydrolase involved in NAD metabolism
MDYISIEAIISSTLSQKRVLHSRSTAQQAKEVIARFFPDTEDSQAAFTVGLWHDRAREWDEDALLSYCLSHKLSMEPEELDQPMLLHGLVASSLLLGEIPDAKPSWLLAVRWHTLGSSTMGVLGAAVYIADYLEPLRTHLDQMERIRLLQSDSLETMCLRIIIDQEYYFGKKCIPIARSTMGLKKFLLAGGRF